MVYILKCKDVEDVGVPSCPYVARGRDKDDVVKMEMDHFENSHPDEYKKALKDMSPEEIEKKMEDSVEEEDEEEVNGNEETKNNENGGTGGEEEEI
jgi:predicted small metal-binding protein